MPAMRAAAGSTPTQLTDAIDRTANLIEPAKVLAGIAAAAAAPTTTCASCIRSIPSSSGCASSISICASGTIEAAPAAAPVAEAETEEHAPGQQAQEEGCGAARGAAAAHRRARAVNMEQWRWMPDDLGPLHVVVNIPEFQVRVMKDGRPIHTERVVTGTGRPIRRRSSPRTWRPWCSSRAGACRRASRSRSCLPGLLAGRDPVGGRGYRMSYRGREVSPSSIDWRTVDIRKVSIVQPPGPGNALGQVKFLFPNKHDVYMHDTPSKSLFNADMRAFSHGCVRVRNPMRFAEILFAETAGWAPQRVASLVTRQARERGQDRHRVGVHLTYFTVVVDDDGKAHTFRDIYGHEARVQGGLEGRTSQVAKKVQDLNAVRSALVGRAPARRVASTWGDDDDRPRGRGGQRSRAQGRSGGGGGGFWWFGN